MKKLLFLCAFLPFLALADSPGEGRRALDAIHAQTGDVLVRSLLQTENNLRGDGYADPKDMIFLRIDESRPGEDPDHRLTYILTYYFYRPNGERSGECTNGNDVVQFALQITGIRGASGELKDLRLHRAEISRYKEPGACPPVGGSTSGG